MAAIIEVEHLVKHYKGTTTPAVADVSFEIAPGEMFSLLGPNGAGKTTTISMLSGLIDITAGEARIDGHSVKTAPMAVKQVLGVVPQDLALYPTLTALENLRFWGQMYGLGGAELGQRIDEVLEVVELRERAKERIETYSGGMKRRINIAVGLLHRPKVLFLDEPTVAIDPQSRRNILDMVKRLNDEGMTVLYTTHYMEEAEELSDRIGIIDHGKLIAVGTLDTLTQIVGEQDAVELRVDAEIVPEDLLRDLQAIGGVNEVTAGEAGHVRLLADDGNAALTAVIPVVNGHGLKITALDVQEPNLEAVFLKLTGRALRD